MFSFLTFSFFIMAVILPSGRLSKGKALAELPSHHLPKSAQALASPLSEGDREVLHYMLAFGLHLQILAGLVHPTSKRQWMPWKASPAEVHLKGDHAFSYHSLHSMSGRPQKASSLFAHKPSCTCYCFSCYSSFWRRWAASPNRDLLNMIIEITEMSEEEEEQKASKGKEKKKKKQRTLEAGVGGKKAKGGKWKLQSNLKPSATAATSLNMVDAASTTEVANDALGCTSMDVMYDALRDNASTDAVCDNDGSGTLPEVQEMFPAEDVRPCRTKGDARMQIPSRVPPVQDRAPVMLQGEVDGSSVTQATSPGGRLFASKPGKNNLNFQRAGKRKSRQITPLVFEGAFPLIEEVQESDVLSGGKAQGSLCPSLADDNLKGKGFLSLIFSDALRDIASRLWDLVSMGSPNRSMDYY